MTVLYVVLAALVGTLAGIALALVCIGYAQMLIDDVREWMRR